MVNQINKGRKRLNHYEINDLIRIFILKIDRFDVDQPILPYKILEKINNQYQIWCKFEIINILYLAGEIDFLNTKQFLKLNEILTNEITFCEAACLQNVSMTMGSICNCKSLYNNKKCCCKKMGNVCSSRCHSSR